LDKKLNIIVIEDEVVSCTKLTKILEPYGNCNEFYEGSKAIEFYDNFLQNGKRINLITLDIAMPVLDGIRTLEQLRTVEKNNNIGEKDAAKIIMVTSSFDKDQITACFEKGCNDYIIKPFDEEKLLDRLKNNNLV